MSRIKINLNEGECFFKLTGDIGKVFKNRRLMFSLKRLGYTKGNKDLIIPFKPEFKIPVLQELQELLNNFGFIEEENIEAEDSLNNYYKEQRTFKEFSEKANYIRNNKFKNIPKLEEDFMDFHKVILSLFDRKRTPRNFQWLSAFHMAFSQNSCNFSVPGAGKTLIVYAAYIYLKNIENPDKRISKLVVIGPKSCFLSWESEYKECFGREVQSQRISGDVNINERKQHLASGNPAELTLISLHSVPSLQVEINDFIKNNNVMLVVDEAHKIKGLDGKNAKSILEVGKEASSRIILTGTPLPNGYQDLYNLYKFIYPYHYKNILQFHYGNLKEMTKNAEIDGSRVNKLINNISPFFIRIKKDDLKLPPIKNNIITVKMDFHQREIYDFIENQYVKTFRENSSATNNVRDILNKAKLIRLRQASTNPSLLIQPILDNLDREDSNANYFKNSNEEIADIDIFQEILNYRNVIPNKFIEINNLLKNSIIPKLGKVIIWTIFVKNAEQLQDYLKTNDIKSMLLLGYVEQHDREVIVQKFNDPDNLDFQVVIANPFTVAESISLHKGCHNAIYMERDYNCANFLQSIDRIHRVGLDPNQVTNYYYYLSKDSIDEVINYKLDEKAERMSKIIDGDIPLLSRLHDEDETDLIQALIKNHDQRNS